MIGGNKIALLQVKDEGILNAIGEAEHKWSDVASTKGWLDFLSGGNGFADYNAKFQDSTHVFLCDFDDFKSLSKRWVWNPFSFVNGVIETDKQDGTTVDVTSENARILIDGNIYQIEMIDNPMRMNQHLEIFLKFVGGGLGVN